MCREMYYAAVNNCSLECDDARGSSLAASFASMLTAIGSLAEPSPELQSYFLNQVRAVAAQLDFSTEAGSPAGYARLILYEVPGKWSLAAIILRPGQETEPHDHGGWGCAVTVQGIERDRRYIHNPSGQLVLSSECDYPPGAGYIFDPVDIHQPFGADPYAVTVALHFMVHGHHPEGW